MLSNGQVLFKCVRENGYYFVPQTNSINQRQQQVEDTTNSKLWVFSFSTIRLLGL